MCVECEDMPAQLSCLQCQDDFCQVCFQSLHRKGTRKHHVAKRLTEEDEVKKDVSMSVVEDDDELVHVQDI